MTWLTPLLWLAAGTIIGYLARELFQSKRLSIPVRTTVGLQPGGFIDIWVDGEMVQAKIVAIEEHAVLVERPKTKKPAARD